MSGVLAVVTKIFSTVRIFKSIITVSYVGAFLGNPKVVGVMLRIGEEIGVVRVYTRFGLSHLVF